MSDRPVITRRTAIGARTAAGSPPILVMLLVLAFVGLAKLAGVGDSVVVPALINIMLVLALYTFSGNSGIFSFGHVGFMAIGAYTAAILTIPPGTKNVLYAMPPWLESLHLAGVPAVLMASVVAALVALLFGLPIIRLDGIAASIGTFAFLVIVHTISQNLEPVTNGQSGMTAVPKTATVTTVLIAIGITLAVVFLYQQSTAGLRLRASREDAVAARGSGIRNRRERRISWVLSAAIAGAAGGLYAEFLGTIAPDSFYLELTFVIVAMLVIGGSRSMSGAVVGAIALSTISELLRQLGTGLTIGDTQISGVAQITPVLLALFMLLVLIFRPAGLTGGKEFSIPSGARRPRRNPDQATPQETESS